MAFRPVRLQIAYALAACESLKSTFAHTPKKQIPAEIQQQFDVVMNHYQTLQQARASLDSFPIRKVDQSLDRMVAHLDSVARSVIRAYETVPLQRSDNQERRWKAAHLVLSALFPDGVKAITTIAYIQEWEAVQAMVAKIAANKGLQQAIHSLGLQDDLAMLEQLHELYGKTLGIVQGKEQPSETSLLAAWYESYKELMVIASYLGRKQPYLIPLVYQPYEEQVTKQAAARIRTRHKKASNSESGDELSASDAPEAESETIHS
jgi:hypothetical protein